MYISVLLCGSPTEDKFAKDCRLKDLATQKLVATGERDRYAVPEMLSHVHQHIVLLQIEATVA